MRRWIALCLFVAACGGGRSREPAWPKSDPVESWEDDGGESIAPRETADVASVESSEEPEPAAETTYEVTVEIDEPAPDELIIIDAPPPPPSP